MHGALVTTAIWCGFIYLAGLAREKIGNIKNSNQSKQQQTTNEVKNIKHKKSKKRKVWAVIIAVFFIYNIFFYHQPNEQNIEWLKTDKNSDYSERDGNLYRNTKYNFRIKFPEGWDIENGSGPNIVQKAVKGNHTISIGVKEKANKFSDKTVTIKDVMNITDILEGVQEQPSAEIIDYGESMLYNKPTYWVKYSATYTTLDITMHAIMTQYQLLNNDIFYFITAGSTSDEYQSIEAEIMKSISTFVIEDY